MKKLRISLIALVLSIPYSLFASGSAEAAACPNPNKDGKTIGKVIVGKTTVDVKYIDYPEGGELDPPASPLNVGLSIRHMPLSSPIGSSLLAWHINYKGCDGKLNVINNKKVGYKFQIVDEKGFTQIFTVSKIVQVPKGKYKPEWFQLNGPRQLVFVTCTGKVVNRHYTDNLVIIANPADATAVPSTSPSTSPSASPSVSPNTSVSPSPAQSPSASATK